MQQMQQVNHLHGIVWCKTAHGPEIRRFPAASTESGSQRVRHGLWHDPQREPVPSGYFTGTRSGGSPIVIVFPTFFARKSLIFKTGNTLLIPEGVTGAWDSTRANSSTPVAGQLCHFEFNIACRRMAFMRDW